MALPNEVYVRVVNEGEEDEEFLAADANLERLAPNEPGRFKIGVYALVRAIEVELQLVTVAEVGP